MTKAKASRLAEKYEPEASPYQFVFKGALTFLQADRFARLIDPERAAEDRPFLFIVDQFIGAKHIIISQREIQEIVWINSGVDYSETREALDRLAELGVVRELDRKGLGPAIIQIGKRVTSAAFGAGTIKGVSDSAVIAIGERVTTTAFGGGTIVSVSSLSVGVRFDNGALRSMQSGFLLAEPCDGSAAATVKPSDRPVVATVEFEDGKTRSMDPARLHAETTVAMFGLSRLVEAEEQIAAILSRNVEIDLSADELAEIEWVLDHAAEVLNRPGFVPNETQRQAVRQAFKYRFSICTGNPGTGKTAVVIALVCAIAARLSPPKVMRLLPVLWLEPLFRSC